MGKGKKKRATKTNQTDLDIDLDDNSVEYEPSESEDDFGTDEKILIESRRGIKKQSVEEEEVFGIHSSSDDEDEEEDDGNEFYGGGSDMDSDIVDKDGEDSEDGLPDSKAWGKDSRRYYNTDYVDKDYGGMSKEDEELADMEEQEAANIQKRLMSHMEESDFTLGLLDKVEEKKTEFEQKKDDLTTKEKIIKDLSKLSQMEKIQLLKKESPELFQLIDDFKENMGLAQNKLIPIMDLVRSKTIKICDATEFVKTLISVITNYSINILYYLMLKSKRCSIDSHPVINRLYTYKKVMDEMLYVLEDKLMTEIDEILEKNSEGTDLNEEPMQQSDEPVPKNRAERRKLKLKIVEEAQRREKLIAEKKAKLAANKGEEKSIANSQILSDIEDEDIPDEEEIEEGEDDVESGKRAITYEMKKNKGLTARRKKEDRNPRVKNRNKFKKAVKRRRGQVRQPRTETTRYGGELSGIKSYLSKSVKIKV